MSYLLAFLLLCGGAARAEFVNSSGDDSQSALEILVDQGRGPALTGTCLADTATPTPGEMQREELVWLKVLAFVGSFYLGAFLAHALLRQVKL